LVIAYSILGVHSVHYSTNTTLLLYRGGDLCVWLVFDTCLQYTLFTMDKITHYYLLHTIYQSAIVKYDFWRTHYWFKNYKLYLFTISGRHNIRHNNVNSLYLSENVQSKHRVLIYDFQLLRHDKMKLRLISYDFIRLLRSLSHDNIWDHMVSRKSIIISQYYHDFNELNRCLYIYIYQHVVILI